MARGLTPDSGYSGRSQGGLGASQSGRNKSGVGKIVIRLDDPEIKQILRAFSRMDKAANTDLKDLSRSISQWLVPELARASMNHRWYPEQAQRLASSIRVSRDRVPAIMVGGARRFTNRDGQRVAYGSLLFGNEFGAFPSFSRDRFRNRFQQQNQSQGGLQFPPRSPREGRGNRGYWIFPRLKRLQPRILGWWLEGAKEVADLWKAR